MRIYDVFICVICISLMKSCYRLNPVTVDTIKIKVLQKYGESSGSMEMRYTREEPLTVMKFYSLL